MSPVSLRLFRKLHRWLGLFLAALILFYCGSGILLNHRRYFSYFTDKEYSTTQVPPSDTTLMREFIDSYKRQIGRQDDPTVIRIRGAKTIEFLYGSHGKTTYIIDPSQGTMTTIKKRDRAPWGHISRLHKIVRTSALWGAIADFSGLAIALVALSGLLIFRYSPLDWLMLLGGGILLGAGIWLP